VLVGALAFAVMHARAAPVGKKRTARPLIARFAGAVPVLLYHRLGPGSGSYSVAPTDFAAEMQRLHDLGFNAVSLDQYVRFVRGDRGDLPQRPVLITFDDAYSSSWEVADPILARYGWSAAMYVPTAVVGRPGRLSWDDLQQMESSGRWAVDEHAGDGHVLIPAGPSGRRLPFYASERWADGAQESFSHYQERVSGDVEHGLAQLRANIKNWSSHASFAVPFNNYGQNGSNDPRIEPWFRSFLDAHFAVVFVQRDDTFTRPSPGLENRIAVAGSWDADTLEAHLVDGLRRLKQAG
jgi:peptidoglycan/xylan/chitin deacetylase (PgdA/CDA1 family)